MVLFISSIYLPLARQARVCGVWCATCSSIFFRPLSSIRSKVRNERKFRFENGCAATVFIRSHIFAWHENPTKLQFNKRINYIILHVRVRCRCECDPITFIFILKSLWYGWPQNSPSRNDKKQVEMTAFECIGKYLHVVHSTCWKTKISHTGIMHDRRPPHVIMTGKIAHTPCRLRLRCACHIVSNASISGHE